MKKYKIFKVIATLSVAIGISLIIFGMFRLIEFFGKNDLFQLLSFMPKWVIQFVGVMNMATFLPFFIFGFAFLGRNGAIGLAISLRTGSAYKYIRNPMYAGLSFTVFGIGALLGSTSIGLSGIVWFIICYFVTKFEEKDLEKRFGNMYIEYKNATPLFIPDFEILFRDTVTFVLKKKDKTIVQHG